MKTILLLFTCLVIASLVRAQVILVPADYPTIQQGINASADGFTVLVSPGTYVENIDFKGKDITVASLFLTTQDTSYIPQTIIDGNHAGSVVTIKSGEDSTAQLCGFTITNGYAYHGGGIYCDGASPNLNNLVITENSAYGHYVPRWYYAPGYGGGIYINNSNPCMHNMLIKNNNTTDNGGGIYCCISSPVINKVILTENSAESGGGIYLDYESNVDLKEVTISYNTAGSTGGGIYTEGDCNLQFDSINRCNIYSNEADAGNDLTFNSYWQVMQVIVDTFTVLNPTVYHAAPFEYFTFDILHGKHLQVDADLYVSPAGNNENDGLSPQTPLKTIHHAFSFLLADSLHQNTIHLLEGTYSDSVNGERFPVVIPDYISLEGNGPASVILDNKGTAGYVVSIVGNQWNRLSGMTIKGGYGFASGAVGGPVVAGGGIYCYDSDPVLENLAVTANTSYPGGGMYFVESDPLIKDVAVFDNTSDLSGGGILCIYSWITMMNCTVSGNHAYQGGGIGGIDSYLNLVDVNLTGNTSNIGGGIYCEGSALCAENTSFSDNSSYHYGGGVCCKELSNLVLRNVLITGNSSTLPDYGYGGGIYSQGSELTLINTTMADNSGTNGGGIYADGSNTITVTNCILWNDDPQEICYTPQGGWPYGNKEITVTHTDIEGGPQAVVINNLVTINWIEAILDEDPLFAGSGEHPYAITWSSQCKDYGTSDTSGLYLPEADIMGNVRIWDGDWDGIATVDMGAYEYGSVPVGIEVPEFTSRETGSGLYCFPVPATTLITVETPGFDYPRLITISNLNGKKLLVLPATGSGSNIDISGLPPGFYLIRLTCDETVTTGRFIKQ